jgi:NMD protein affecting ribosome stability and mRNA decay
MGVRTRIGTEGLTGKGGSIELPDNIELFCPECGTPAADKGQCLVEFIKIPNKEMKTGWEVRLNVDCRSCGCYNHPPATK